MKVSSPPTSTQLNTTTTAAVPLLTPPSNEPNANHVCFGCGLPIIDRHFYATLPDIKWHESCLRCAKCDCRLKENSTCFIKNGKAYCKEDYSLLFPIIKCAKCQLQIKRSDLVFKMATGNNLQPKVFHLNCFSCQVCSRQFQTGDEYQMIDDYVYCKEDGQMVLQQTGGGYTATIVNTPTNHHQQSSSQTSTSIYSSNSQLYMNLMNNNSSTVSLTPENSIQSSSSSSSSFSPNTNSSSSSIVDSPSNTSSYLPPIYSQSNSSFTYASGYPMMAHPQQVHPQMMPPVYSNLQASNHGFMTASVDGNNNSTAKDEPKNEVTNEEESGTNRRGMESDEDEIDDSDGEDSDSGSAAEGEEMDETTSSSLNESLNHHKSAKKGQNSYPKPMMNSAKMTSQRPQHQPQYPQLHHPNHHHHLLQIKSGHHHSKPARIRTVLNERQLGMLRECYRNNPRPDALMKEQLVEITGLNPRVIRVWFQNKRCKDKKKNMLAPATNTTPNQPGQLPQLTQQMNIRNTNLMPEATSYNQGMVYNSNHPNYDY